MTGPDEPPADPADGATGATDAVGVGDPVELSRPAVARGRPSSRTAIPETRIWFNQTWRGNYQLIGLLRDGAGPGRRLTVIGSHAIASTPFLQACDEVVDEPPEVGDAFVDAALELCRRHRVDVFVPNREMLAVAERADRFAAAGVAVMCSPAAAVRTFTTKSGQYAAMADRGLPVPRTVTVTTLDQFRAAYEGLSAEGLTVCFKPDVDHGGQGFRVLDPDAEDLAALFVPPSARVAPATVERILGAVPSFPALLVGQFLEGPEYSVDVLSRDGRMLAAVPRGKSGLPWTRELVDDPEVVELARRVVAAFGLRYLSNVQIRYDGRRPVVLEVNTRAASGTYQSAAAGVNLPWLALRLALGQPVEVPRPSFPHTLIAYTEAMPMRRPGDRAVRPASDLRRATEPRRTPPRAARTRSSTSPGDRA